MRRKRNVRKQAILMAGILLFGTMITTASACGSNGTSTDISGTVGTEKQQEQVDMEVTALSLMQETNTKEAVLSEDNYRTWYEVFVYSYYDSDGDGIGDLKGLTGKLDYINDGDAATDTDLGCDGIWLMPIMPSTTYHKYDVTDYCAVDSEYGTLEDFETFVDACHERGVNVIIDLVMNHSSTQHTWFKEAAAYLKSLSENEEPDLAECPYVDYYNFSREKKGGYCELPGSDWYYEARFWSEMPDLNLGNENVRAEFEQIVDFWLDLGVDGFRLDAAKEYYTDNVSANVEVLTWFNTMVKEKKADAYIVAEVWSNMETYAQYYESGIDSCFDFSFADQSGTIVSVLRGTAMSGASSYGKALEKLQETLGTYSDSYIDAPFYTNHDMARSAGYFFNDFGENQTKMAEAMNLMMSGSCFLYYGEELGMKGSGKDENKRAPMYWSKDAEAEGMCDGPADMEIFEMKYDSFTEQQNDGDSIYSFVKEAIHVRNSYPAITHGIVAFEEEYSDENVCVIRKTYEDEQVLLVFNISTEPQTIDFNGIALSNKTGDELVIGSLLLTEADGSATYTDGVLTVPAYSVVVLE